MNQPDKPGLRALKLLVVVMGIMIVAGVAVIIATIVGRLGDRAERSVEPAAPVATSFGETRVALPAGATVAETAIGDGRAVLRLDLPNGRRALLVLDLDTGGRLGLIWLDGGQE